MARQMFYTLEEAAQRLGVDPQAVKDMAAQGQLQQFRDRDQLMFKRDEVEGLAAAGDTTADSPIGLGDTTADAPTLSPDDTAGESEPIPLDASDDTQGGGEIQLSPDDTDSTDAITPSNTGTGTDAISLAEEDSVPEPSSADSSAGS
ncbi:MAG: helix-turn-helix domain-containing protein, partial [Phycisphaeraceae bacterium]